MLIRTLLSHCYQKEGVNFLVNNFEQIIPEHLLFLSEVLMDFEDFGLIDLVVNNNGEGMDKLPKGLRDNEIEIVVNRKNIKNLHLSVLPPDGRVRVPTPIHTSEQAIRLAVIGKLAWIKKQQRDFVAQPKQSSREMVNGESHYLWGQRYRLSIVDTTGRQLARAS